VSNRRRPNPRTVFLRDQAEGAAQQTQGHVARFAGELGKTSTQDLDHPVVQRLTRFLADWVDNELIGLCEHLDPGAPQPMHWVPSKPEQLLCSICVVAVGGVMLQQVVGTLPCDHCGRTGVPLDGVRIAIGHVLILGIACPDCLALGSSS
jgi:hypothetical protein